MKRHLISLGAIACTLSLSLSVHAGPAPAAEAAPAPAPLPEVNRAANNDKLLEMIRQDRLVQSRANEQLIAEFQKEQGQRQRLLEQARGQRTAEEQKSTRLDSSFQENERAIGQLQEQRDARFGALKELFGVLQQVAGDTRGVFSASILSAQFPGREQWLLDFAKKMGNSNQLATIDEMTNLWAQIQQEMTESGKVAKFSGELVLGNGETKQTEIVRVGAFNLVADTGYVKYDSETKKINELPRQPPGRAPGTADDLISASAGALVGFAIDPTRGALVEAQGGTATLGERIGSPFNFASAGCYIPFCNGHGGPVGSIIIILGIIGIALALERFFSLFLMGSKVNRQLQSATPSDDNPLGRVLKAYDENKDVDVETLELKLSEAILIEAPKVNRLISIIQVISVVAPLLGLLGTVVGMIQTFEAITLFGAGDPKTMAEGISVALITTVEGLVVAIPTVLLHSIVNGRAKSIIHVLEEQSAGLIAEHAEKAGRPLG